MPEMEVLRDVILCVWGLDRHLISDREFLSVVHCLALFVNRFPCMNSQLRKAISHEYCFLD